jgi:hypothetical protein
LNITEYQEKFKIFLQKEYQKENLIVYTILINNQNFTNHEQSNSNKNEELIHINDVIYQPSLKKYSENFKFKSLTNTTKEKKKSISRLLISNEQVKNPCYLKGYFNQAKNMIGTGDFQNCYLSLLKMITKDDKIDINNRPSQKENSVIKIKINKPFQFLDNPWKRFQRIIRLF